MAGRASGCGGAANVHADHVGEATLGDMMYNVEVAEEAFGVYQVCEPVGSVQHRAGGRALLVINGEVVHWNRDAKPAKQQSINN